MDLLPHRYPILLVDRILDFEPGQWIRGSRTSSMSEMVFQGHFPKPARVPGRPTSSRPWPRPAAACIMQEFEDRDKKVIYFMGIDGVKFRKPVLPGDQLVMEVKVLQHEGRICKMRGEAFVDGQKVAEAEFMSMLMDLDEGETK